MDKINFKIERDLTDEEKQAISIVKTLQDNGFEAYFAGGAVRDELLGIPAHDIDIATSAKPDEIQKLFQNTYDRGKAFGVIAVRFGNPPAGEAGFEFEVATFRTDLGIADHRRPKKIEFTTAEIDAKRRDFTINGLFYDPISSQIIDFVGGIADLKRKLIRFIGKPQDRIDEDYLRMLRAIRFASRFGFIIEPTSKKAIKEKASKILDISAERIRDELGKILLSTNREWAIREMEAIGLLKELLPELEATKNIPQPKEFHKEGTVWIHILLCLKNIETIAGGPTEELVWTVLLHDIAKPETLGYRSKIGKTSITFFDHDVKSAEKAKAILERLRFSHHFIEAVCWAISQHMRIINAFRGMSERKQKKLFSDPNIGLLLELTRVDLSASLRPNGKPDMTMYQDALKLKEKFEKESTEEEKHQVKKFDLINGKDIMEILGIEPGPEVGTIKSEIEREYLEGKINSRKDAIKMLGKYKK